MNQGHAQSAGGTSERAAPPLSQRISGLFGIGSDESLTRRLAGIAPPLTLFAVLVSLLVHLVVALIAALIVVGVAQAGGAGGRGASVEFAIVTEMELSEIQSAALDATAPAIPDAELPTPTNAVDIQMPETTPGGEAAGSLESGATLTTGLGAGDLGVGGLGIEGAGGGAASFFGVEARGNRFAYVCDVSGSMAYGGRIESLQRELNKSVGALMEHTHLFIVLFSNNATPLGGKREWLQATDPNKAATRRAVSAISSGGGTDPIPGFEMIFSVRPRPDAIYFMTDGEFDASAILRIAALNHDHRVPIHCIAFGTREPEQHMKRIAADSGGTYTFVLGPLP